MRKKRVAISLAVVLLTSAVAVATVRAEEGPAAGSVERTPSSGARRGIRLDVREFGKRVPGLAQALPAVAGRPRLPDRAVAGDPVDVYVVEGVREEERALAVRYPRGLVMTAQPNRPKTPDYDGVRAQSAYMLPFTDGRTEQFRPLEIFGCRGLIAERGTQIVGDSGTVEVPACVIWYEGGTEYGLQSYDMTAAELLKVAQSMDAR